MIKKIIIGLCVMGSFFIWSGCGGSYEAPAGSTITITGIDTITDSNSSTVIDSTIFHIAATAPNSDPLNDVEISITYPWAIPSPAGAVQLYDGDDPEDSPMKVETDSYGTYNLRIDYQRGGGVEYTGTIQVTSGSAVGTAEFSVSSGSGT